MIDEPAGAWAYAASACCAELAAADSIEATDGREVTGSLFDVVDEAFEDVEAFVDVDALDDAEELDEPVFAAAEPGVPSKFAA